MTDTQIVELIGVYDADGGLRGETAYVVGKLLGRVHCSLCDITHSPLRRKPEWDKFTAQLGIPFTLLHRNETTDDVRAALVDVGTPAVLARTQDGSLGPLLRPEELDSLDGSIAALTRAVQAHLPT